MNVNQEAKVQALYSLSLHPEYGTLIGRVANIKKNYFPELDSQWVYVGMFGVIEPKKEIHGNADIENCIISFNVAKKVTNVVIFHEMMHLAQWRDVGAPRTEEYCSICATARMPPEMVDEDKIPYINVNTIAPPEKFPSICKHALKLRSNGHKSYIAYVRNVLQTYNEFTYIM